MSDFGAFLGKVAGKVSNAANCDRKLKCYGCNKITNHISISYADAFKAAGSDNIFFATYGVTMDLVPAAFPITFGNPYACSDCKKIRFEGGIASNATNKDLNIYL